MSLSFIFSINSLNDKMIGPVTERSDMPARIAWMTPQKRTPPLTCCGFIIA